jgi:hypothetical protein
MPPQKRHRLNMNVSPAEPTTNHACTPLVGRGSYMSGLTDRLDYLVIFILNIIKLYNGPAN